MQWVIKFLQKRLKQEEDIAAFHGSIAKADRKYAESARMARERIPQLQWAIKLLDNHIGLIRSEKGREVRRVAPKDRPPNQLEIFK